MSKACGSHNNCKEKKTTLFIKNSYPILKCQTCEHRFIEIPDEHHHLSSVYSDDYFFAGEAGYPNYLNEKDLLYNQGLRYARLIGRYANPGKVLDVGCAAGFILKGFEKSDWSCHGVEPNETMVAYGRDELHLDIKAGSLETYESADKFDLINLIQVIGHVYDVDRALQNIKNLLKPNALVLVESWNMKSMFARILGKHWPEYSPPSVVHWYSDKTLTSLFNYYGFELVDKGYPIKKISMAHGFSLLEGKTANKFLKKVIRIISHPIKKLSLVYPFFDVKWYIFRNVSVQIEKNEFPLATEAGGAVRKSSLNSITP